MRCCIERPRGRSRPAALRVSFRVLPDSRGGAGVGREAEAGEAGWQQWQRGAGATPPAERRGAAAGSRPGSTLPCKNRAKTFSLRETLELISPASFPRNLPEGVLESNERKPAKEGAGVPTAEPGRGRSTAAVGRCGAHTTAGQTHRDVLPDRLTSFLSPSVSKVCALANACTSSLMFLKKGRPLQWSTAHLYVLQPAFPGDLRIVLSRWRRPGTRVCPGQGERPFRVGALHTETLSHDTPAATGLLGLWPKNLL